MISAVLLAAGASRRFGASSKLVVPVAGEPMLARIAREARAGGVDEIVVVTGAYPDAVRAALSGVDVRSIHHAAWADGIGGSIAAGVVAISPKSCGAFVLLGDMPRLARSEIAALIAAFTAAEGLQVVVPVDRDRAQRNPVLWPRAYFPSLAGLSGDRGAKSLIAGLAAHERRDVVFTDTAIFADIDTREDLARLNGEP